MLRMDAWIDGQADGWMIKKIAFIEVIRLYSYTVQNKLFVFKWMLRGLASLLGTARSTVNLRSPRK